MKKSVLAVVAAFVLVCAVPQAAAATETIDPAIVAADAQEPGGVIVDAHTIVWPEEGKELTVLGSSASSVSARATLAGCDTGKVCAYSGSNATGSKLSWSTCGSHSTSLLASVGSIANGRSSGNLQARNGTTVVATAGPGATKNVFSTVTNVKC